MRETGLRQSQRLARKLLTKPATQGSSDTAKAEAKEGAKFTVWISGLRVQKSSQYLKSYKTLCEIFHDRFCVPSQRRLLEPVLQSKLKSKRLFSIVQV